ncbi:glycerol-3-phosphate acyltransferase [Bacillus cereus]|uniref:Glycerol-3-phosphate acyltransferase n=1 Tax=Bacillus cereus TaxID=1396 RepID=A0A9X7QP05_BACCE|nr:glycerol-3-phosphate acyltransferase [Bacillus cereus]QDZ77472.1 glycerol-3-phosphate acyltransferase [Bacillus cereus]
MDYINILFYLLFSYLLGGLLTGYFFVVWLNHTDIRQMGSGNPGARNVGRLYGRLGFITVFVGDACKGIIVVFFAMHFFNNDWIALLSLLFVVAGHIYPLWFRYQGGKGVATCIGGLCTLQLELISVLFLVFLGLFLLFKDFSKTGLLTLIGVPIGLWIYSYSYINVMISTLLILLILFAHRKVNPI